MVVEAGLLWPGGGGYSAAAGAERPCTGVWLSVAVCIVSSQREGSTSAPASAGGLDCELWWWS